MGLFGSSSTKYNGAKKRKTIIIGPAESGKTTLYRLINGYEKEDVLSLYIPTDKFSNV